MSCQTIATRSEAVVVSLRSSEGSSPSWNTRIGQDLRAAARAATSSLLMALFWHNAVCRFRGNTAAPWAGSSDQEHREPGEGPTQPGADDDVVGGSRKNESTGETP